MINPVLTFIENMKLIEREKETKRLDEHAKYMLALESMKLEVFDSSIEQLARAIDDQHIVGSLDLRGDFDINGDLGLNNEHWNPFVVKNYHHDMKKKLDDES